MSLGDLVQRAHGGMPVGQVDYEQMPTGPGKDDQRQVVSSGIRLFRFEGQPVAVRHQGMNPQFGRETGTLEVMRRTGRLGCADGPGAGAHGRAQRHPGQVVTFGSDPYGPGMAGVTFVARPSVDAAAVVLPDGVLDRVAHHVIGMGEQRERLRRTASTSSAACCSTARRARARRTRCATCSRPRRARRPCC